ncbi:hypothetical protein Ddye_013618 [Dipteronia dyeriana]|uniref:Uncharacterized protein n=1 Tax=Dipteronia dyeriana TaxID=168575 RepID=A0AAD9X6R7_9ROSI|nr:hypothetical protein Ddye_013618 [Dipteronia dyeriana]
MGGQMRLNGDGPNDASFGFGVGTVGDSTFGTCLAPGNESSSAGFNHGNYQIPTSFYGVNEQGRTSSSTLPSMAQRQFCLGNDEQNDFMFDPIMNDNNVDYVFDNIADPQQFRQFVDMMNEATDHQFPYHQQQGDNDYLTSELSDMICFWLKMLV